MSNSPARAARRAAARGKTTALTVWVLLQRDAAGQVGIAGVYTNRQQATADGQMMPPGISWVVSDPMRLDVCQAVRARVNSMTPTTDEE